METIAEVDAARVHVQAAGSGGERKAKQTKFRTKARGLSLLGRAIKLIPAMQANKRTSHRAFTLSSAFTTTSMPSQKQYRQRYKTACVQTKELLTERSRCPARSPPRRCRPRSRR